MWVFESFLCYYFEGISSPRKCQQEFSARVLCFFPSYLRKPFDMIHAMMWFRQQPSTFAGLCSLETVAKCFFFHRGYAAWLWQKLIIHTNAKILTGVHCSMSALFTSAPFFSTKKVAFSKSFSLRVEQRSFWQSNVRPQSSGKLTSTVSKLRR